jgi:glycosyltransferase involved in cell wall biosynthesis
LRSVQSFPISVELHTPKELETMKNIKPYVSIGLPVYNGQQYLKIAIDSILNQTFQDFEIIISDNASTDLTEKICREYAESDSRVYYHRSPQNMGVIWNFNRVFELSRADLFRWATADDFIAPQLIEKCVEVLDAEPETVLCCGRTTIVDENGDIVSKHRDNMDFHFQRAKDRYRHFEENLGLCNAHYGLMRSSALRKTRLLGNFLGSDEVFLGELTLYGKFHEIPYDLLFRRFHPQASSNINTINDLAKFYNLKDSKVHKLRLWRHLIEKIAVISRSPLGAWEKTNIFCMLLRNALKDRNRMFEELRRYVGNHDGTQYVNEVAESMHTLKKK